MRLFSPSVIAIACLSAGSLFTAQLAVAANAEVALPEVTTTGAANAEAVKTDAVDTSADSSALPTTEAAPEAAVTATPTRANTFVNDSILPPSITWHGASESLLLSADNEWATPFEQSNGLESPSYDDTITWLDRLAAETTKLQKVSLGKSPQGRDIWMYVASSEGINESARLKQNTKPTILVQAGIHAGEIDGKDAGMMLLRDIIKGDKSDLLEKANLLFVPMFSVDAHERSGEFNRV